MSKKEKKKEEKKQSKSEKSAEKRVMVMDTLDELGDFCLDNIMALKPLAESDDETAAALAEDRILKFAALIEVLNTVADLAEGTNGEGDG
ncbi:MAG TPA: hypothetical protein DD624_03890 [Alphaproteobacteria bacterium]|nr:hypothetical protein [Alphaproteobacteria bacterium]